jgi:hypothetical protein
MFEAFSKNETMDLSDICTRHANYIARIHSASSVKRLKTFIAARIDLAAG